MLTNINLYRDTETEKQVLCSFLLEPELLYQVDISSNLFTKKEYRIIYEKMLELYSDGIYFDLMILYNACKNDNIPLDIFLDLSNSAVTSVNIHYHLKNLKQLAFNRKSKEVLENLQQNIGQEDFLINAERLLSNLNNFNREKKEISLIEVLKKIESRVNDAKNSKSFAISTGFQKLDKAIVGFCPKHLIILGAYTTSGKSSFLSELVMRICKAGNSVLVFSVEDSIEDKMLRLVSSLTKISMRDIVCGNIDFEVYKEAKEIISNFKLTIYDDIYTLDEIELKIKKHKIQNDLKIVAIDFVQNLIVKRESIYDRMSEVAIRLQKMAKKYDVCIFALSQISTEERGAIKLRGAQELASAADIVLWIDRDIQSESREFSLIVRKNRPFGKTGKIPMTFNETWTNIYEVENGY